MDKVEQEDIDSMYQDWLKHQETEAKEWAQWRADEITIDRIERLQHEAEAKPVSWADIENRFLSSVVLFHKW